MNWDQTGSNYVPENNCTVDFEGVKKLPCHTMMKSVKLPFFYLVSLWLVYLYSPKLEYQVKSDSCHPRAPL